MKSLLRILHLEDNPDDAELVRYALTSGGVSCVLTCVRTRKEFVSNLETNGFDLVLADYSIAGFDGMEALRLVRQRFPDIPFILISGTVGEDRAIESLTGGATDYVLKARMSRLVPAVRRARSEIDHRVARQRAETAREQYSRKLQELSRRLVEAQEAERRHIARELHDEIGQTLTVAQLRIQTLLREQLTEPLRVRLRESLEAVERVLKQVHDMSLNLRPCMLDDLGLEPALRWYTQRQAALVGLKVELLTPLLPHRLDAQIETECFRIAQEALTNVVRHAHASTVTVELQQAKGQLHLNVRDDGIGFEVVAERDQAGASLGLLSMEERAALAGGSLEITSSARQGTTIHASFPLRWRTGKTSSDPDA